MSESGVRENSLMLEQSETSQEKSKCQTCRCGSTRFRIAIFGTMQTLEPIDSEMIKGIKVDFGYLSSTWLSLVLMFGGQGTLPVDEVKRKKGG